MYETEGMPERAYFQGLVYCARNFEANIILAALSEDELERFVLLIDNWMAQDQDQDEEFISIGNPPPFTRAEVQKIHQELERRR
jgi:hypothetical protein